MQNNPNLRGPVVEEVELKDYSPPKHPQFILSADKSFFENNPIFNFNINGITTVPSHDFYGSIMGAVKLRRRYELDLPTNELPDRQFLPYDILTKVGRDFKRRYFAYMRENTGGEKELHNRVSIGGGGHIDASSVVWDGEVIDLPATVHKSATRERTEEFKVTIDGVVMPKEHMASVMDKIFKSNPPTVNIMVVNYEVVDQRHFAIVNVGLVPENYEIDCAEEELTALGFLTYEELTAVENGVPKYNLESWTKVCLEFLEKKSFTKTRPIGIAGEGLFAHEQKPQDGSVVDK